MVEDLVVVARHGDEHIGNCLKSLGDKYPILSVNTGGHPTGAYRHAYEHFPANNYFFMQDSMESLGGDYLAPFKEQQPERGAVAWAVFGMTWDSHEQIQLGQKHYEGQPPGQGIFGPVFYINRASLDELKKKKLLPPVPRNKLEAQGTERYWAWALHNAGMDLIGLSPFNPENGGVGIFKKTFADRK